MEKSVIPRLPQNYQMDSEDMKYCTQMVWTDSLMFFVILKHER